MITKPSSRWPSHSGHRETQRQHSVPALRGQLRMDRRQCGWIPGTQTLSYWRAHTLSLGGGEVEQWDSFPTPRLGFLLITAGHCLRSLLNPMHTMLHDLANSTKLSTMWTERALLGKALGFFVLFCFMKTRIVVIGTWNYLDTTFSNVYVLMNYN